MRNTEIRFHRKILTGSSFWNKTVEDGEVEGLGASLSTILVRMACFSASIF